MLAEQRQREILSRLHGDGIVRVAPLARELNVTEETIRRDLEKLDGEGRLLRVHGGALPVETDRRDLPLRVRETENRDRKRAIARTAVRRINEGDVIAIDASSTALELARIIPDFPLTIVTDSAAIPGVMLERDRIRVIVTGGVLDPESFSFIGPLAERALERFHIQKLFISCRGVDPVRGLSLNTDEQAGLKRRMIDLSDSVYVLADSTKLGVNAVEYFGGADDVDCLITNSDADRHMLEMLDQRGYPVELAPE